MRVSFVTFFVSALVLSVQSNTLNKRSNDNSTSDTADDYDQKNSTDTTSGPDVAMKHPTQSGNDSPTHGISKQCTVYYKGNTAQAVCGGDKSIVCVSGCTGGVVAQGCHLNATSAPTTQTCNVAFGPTSATAYLCTTSEGAFTCLGPHSGSATCNDCVASNSLPGGTGAYNDETHGADAPADNSTTSAPDAKSGYAPADNSTTSAGGPVQGGYGPGANGTSSTDQGPDSGSTGAASTVGSSIAFGTVTLTSLVIAILVGSFEVLLV